MEDSMETSLKTKNKTNIWSSNPTPRHIPWGNQNWKRPTYPNIHLALFTIARAWKQPRCPWTDEWIEKLWQTCTMEYSVQFSRSIVSDSLQLHESQHARPRCPSPTPGVHSVHLVDDAIQPSHPLSSPSPPAPNPSQHQSLFQWVNSLHEVAKVLELQL